MISVKFFISHANARHCNFVQICADFSVEFRCTDHVHHRTWYSVHILIFSCFALLNHGFSLFLNSCNTCQINFCRICSGNFEELCIKFCDHSQCMICRSFCDQSFYSKKGYVFLFDFFYDFLIHINRNRNRLSFYSITFSCTSGCSIILRCRICESFCFYGSG